MSAVIFDFDGTIADSFNLAVELFYEVSHHPKFSAEELAEMRRIPSLRKVAKAVGLTTRQGAKLFIKARTIMGRRLHEIPPCKGIESALADLHKQGHRLFVMSSNSHATVDAFLVEHNLRHYFERVYGGVGLLSKAGALNKVTRQNKLDHADCFYVGDEVRDILAAKRAHIRPISVTWGFNDTSILAAEKPFALAKSPKELVKIVGERGRAARVLSKAKVLRFWR